MTNISVYFYRVNGTERYFFILPHATYLTMVAVSGFHILVSFNRVTVLQVTTQAGSRNAGFLYGRFSILTDNFLTIRFSSVSGTLITEPTYHAVHYGRRRPDRFLFYGGRAVVFVVRGFSTLNRRFQLPDGFYHVSGVSLPKTHQKALTRRSETQIKIRTYNQHYA